MNEYEPEETKLVRELVKEGDVVLDLGANIGQYTLILSELVGYHGRVYAFEPEPNSFKELKKNVRANNVVLVNKAVFNSNETKRLYIRDDNALGSSLHKVHRRLRYRIFKRKYIEVQTVKLDDYFFSGIKIDFIKMDIEGSEYSALKGMKDIISRNKNIKLLTEFYPELINGVEGRDCAEEYLELLRNLGFTLFSIDKKKLTNKQIMEVCKEKQYMNLLCIKQNGRK